MRAGEAKRLAAQHGCELRQAGFGNFKLIGPAGSVRITKAELNRTNEARLTRLLPREGVSA